MNKKIIILSTMVAILIVIGGLSPTIVSKDIKISSKGDTLIAEVNRYYGSESEPIQTELTFEEADEIKQILINLHYAIENNDEDAIDQYEELLNAKGIFGDEYQEFFSNKEYIEKLKSNKNSKLFDLFENNGDNLSNLLCYFNAIGKGLFVSYLGVVVWEAFQKLLSNASGFLEQFIIIILFAPFVLAVIVLTGFIPFRILMPKGMVYMERGRISSIGLRGLKRLNVEESDPPVLANISGFTGLSISIPGNEEKGREHFCFVSGIAIQVSKSES